MMNMKSTIKVYNTHNTDKRFGYHCFGGPQGHTNVDRGFLKRQFERTDGLQSKKKEKKKKT